MKKLTFAKTLALTILLAVFFSGNVSEATAQATTSCSLSNLQLAGNTLNYSYTINFGSYDTALPFVVRRGIRNVTTGDLVDNTPETITPCGQNTCTYSASVLLGPMGITSLNIDDYNLSLNTSGPAVCSTTLSGLANSGSDPDPNSDGTTNNGGNFQLLDGPSSDDLNALNPLRRPDANSDIADQIATPAGLISRLLLFAFPIAGILMLLMLVWGGFEILSGATNKKSLDSGKNRIKAGIAGFMLLFTSYWIVQVIEVVLGIQIF